MKFSAVFIYTLVFQGIAQYCLADTKYVQDVLRELENKKKAQTVTSDEYNKLSEIYFLTSRCDDVLQLNSNSKKLQNTAVLCACDIKMCDEQSWIKNIHLIKEQIKELKTIKFELINGQPEYRYAMIRALRDRQKQGIVMDSNENSIITEFEKELQGLEVK